MAGRGPSPRPQCSPLTALPCPSESRQDKFFGVSQSIFKEGCGSQPSVLSLAIDAYEKHVAYNG